MGWVVGFEPTYTGATTLGLNRLTIPTMLANFAYCYVASSIALVYVRQYVRFVLIRRALHYTKFSAHPRTCLLFSMRCCSRPLQRTLVRAFGAKSTRLVLHEIFCAYQHLHFDTRPSFSALSNTFHISRSACLVLSEISCASRNLFSLLMHRAFIKSWRPGTGSNRRPPA